MRRNEIINDKINFYLNQQTKVHLTKVPTAKFPKGQYHNGHIIEKFSNFILFNDPIEDSLKPIKIFISEIDDIEEYKSPEEENGN